MAKPVLRSGYTFTPASKQISFAGVPGFNINGLLAIFNRTAGVMIFDATEPTLDFASVSVSTVTLKYDTTTGMAVSDVLTIIYDEQVQDGLTNAYTIAAAGNQPGIPTSGYATILVEANGTFNASLIGQFSNDSTNGVDGTWTTAVGFAPEESSTGTGPSQSINSSARRKYFRANDGIWFRVATSSFTSGTAAVTVVRRIAPIGERGIYAALAAGASTIGGTYPVANSASPGTIAARIKSQAGTNAALIVSAARNLYGGTIWNAGTAAAFLKLYDKATAPTVGTDLPVLTVMIPSGGTLNLERTIPRRFSLGLAYAITGGKADGDTTAVAADDVQGELIYV